MPSPQVAEQSVHGVHEDSIMQPESKYSYCLDHKDITVEYTVIISLFEKDCKKAIMHKA